MAQLASNLPSTSVKDLKGSTINTNTFTNDGKPMVISFWATWCKPCLLELNTIAEEYEELQKETGIKLIAISVDDIRNEAKIPAFVNTKGWNYEVYTDASQEFKRAMNVGNVPHTFIIDGTGKIISQHTSFALGDEEELYKQLRELTKK